MLVPIGLAAVGSYFAWRTLDHRFGFSHDVDMLRSLIPQRSFVFEKQKTGWNVARQFVATAARFPDNECLVLDNSSYTFKQVDEISNRVAGWATAQGLKFGDTVALLMENRPEFVITWMGFCKVGVRIAMINHNLRLGPLMHCIKVSGATLVVVGSELVDVVGEVIKDIHELKMSVVVVDDMTNLKTGASSSFKSPVDFAASMDESLTQFKPTPVPAAVLNQAKFDDVWGYIYTSGTTGLPKAGVISHLKYWSMGATFAAVYKVTNKDRIFCVLPLYHSAGGGIGVDMMICSGATFVMCRKFSAKKFWQDVSESKATVVQYIGELCRYLLAAPPSPYDKRHNVQKAIGNGLRPDIWESFQSRFNIPVVGEFYAATEGNLALFNYCRDSESQGFIGRHGLIQQLALGAKIVKFDVEKEEPIRYTNGFCAQTAFGESGELILPITDDNPFSKFNGYTDSKSTEKKVIRNAFKKGDAYFRSGDLITINERGYYSFVDRIGDTFRWKGENVSTMEVAEVLSKVPGILEANVYGVKVPGTDGRACMAACVCSNDLNLNNLIKQLKRELPSYAMPLFIRQLPAMDTTATFKHTKVSLRDEGIDLTKVKDPLIWFSPISRQYEPFDQKAYDLITSGKAKF